MLPAPEARLFNFLLQLPKLRSSPNILGLSPEIVTQTLPSFFGQEGDRVSAPLPEPAPAEDGSDGSEAEDGSAKSAAVIKDKSKPKRSTAKAKAKEKPASRPSRPKSRCQPPESKPEAQAKAKGMAKPDESAEASPASPQAAAEAPSGPSAASSSSSSSSSSSPSTPSATANEDVAMDVQPSTFMDMDLESDDDKFTMPAKAQEGDREESGERAASMSVVSDLDGLWTHHIRNLRRVHDHFGFTAVQTLARNVSSASVVSLYSGLGGAEALLGIVVENGVLNHWVWSLLVP